MPFQGEGAREISSVVWLGILALLFLAVSIHEGWFSGGGIGGILTSGTANDTTTCGNTGGFCGGGATF
jgi:hypothetical protein